MIKPLGEFTILLEWQEGCSVALLDSLIHFRQVLEQEIPGIEESQVVYRTISLHFKQKVGESEWKKIEQATAAFKPVEQQKKRLWKIPVCYTEEFGPDLVQSALDLGLTTEKLIELHCQNTYPVYGIGFLPGFLYLGDVPKSLQLGRKKEPRLSVAAGTVGLAGMQTGIYPQISPGGWKLLGRTPIKFFNPGVDPPCVIEVGDLVKFYPIDPPSFALFEIQVQEGIYELEYQPVL